MPKRKKASELTFQQHIADYLVREHQYGVLEQSDITDTGQFIAEDLSQFEGVGDAKATLILAAIEFARRRIKPEGAKIVTPADLLPHIRHYADRKQEHFLCASINGANEILNIRVVSIGLIDRSPVHPREVFADALSDRASAVIVAHNHPSGGLAPSQSDINITAQLKAAGEIVGIELLDHIIFNRGEYFSFLEDGKL